MTRVDRAPAAQPAWVRSAAWDGSTPDVAVIVPTRDHETFLPSLFAALDAQTFPKDRFEVVVCDDGSTDGTPLVLRDIAVRTGLRFLAIRQEGSAGPATARNTAAAASRAALLAFTDDDCLPAPSWLEEIVQAFSSGVDVVQGATLPDPDTTRGPWDRIIRITGPTVLFETCNIAYRRSTFEAAGRFDASRPKTTAGTREHFGEDARLGWRVRAADGRTTFAPEAVVHHRVLPDDYRGWLREQRRLALFPTLLRDAPEMRRALWGRIFLEPSTAAFDLALVSAVAAAVTRRPWLLAGALPWLRIRWRGASWRGGRSKLVRLAQLGIADAVGFGALVVGSARARRVVL